MSANIYWRPTKNGKDLGVMAPSSFIESLELAFGGVPCTLEVSCLPVLRGMIAATKDSNFEKHYADLIDAIDEHEEIEVFARW